VNVRKMCRVVQATDRPRKDGSNRILIESAVEGKASFVAVIEKSLG